MPYGIYKRTHIRRPDVVQPLDQSIRYIHLTQGQIATVDAADYEWLNQSYWHAHKDSKTGKYYAMRATDNHRLISMHQAILNPPDGYIVDHIHPLETLNNQRSNLRIATNAQNVINTASYPRGILRYRGVKSVYQNGQPSGRCRASICVNGKRLHLGCFDDPVEGALAYDQAAKIHHGEFACLNFR